MFIIKMLFDTQVSFYNCFGCCVLVLLNVNFACHLVPQDDFLSFLIFSYLHVWFVFVLLHGVDFKSLLL